MFNEIKHPKVSFLVWTLILTIGFSVLWTDKVFAACDITVTNTNDSGAGSFQRRAIASLAAFSELGYSLADVLTVQDYILSVPDGAGV